MIKIIKAQKLWSDNVQDRFGDLSVGALDVGALSPRCILLYEDLSPLHLTLSFAEWH